MHTYQVPDTVCTYIKAYLVLSAHVVDDDAVGVCSEPNMLVCFRMEAFSSKHCSIVSHCPLDLNHQALADTTPPPPPPPRCWANKQERQTQE